MDYNIIDLIKKSLLYFDNQNKTYNKFLKDTILNDEKIFSNKLGEEIDDTIILETVEILGIFHHTTNVFLWGWALPYLEMNETTISKELLNYGLQLEPTSNTNSHFFIKSLFINARNYIESDFDLELIQAISSYILKDKFNFIYPLVYADCDNNIITRYVLVKISSK